jgi:hypothetical protein
MFRHLNLRPVGLSLALLNFGLAHSALAQEAGPATTGPDIAALVRPLVEDLNKPEYSQSRCLLAPILAADKRTIAFSRDDTFHSRDQIVAINGEPLSMTSARALHDILVKYPANATLRVRVARAGSETEVTSPCSDNQLYFAMLRAAATAAAQGDAATCADRMADVGRHHALGATWLNVELQCDVKAGRVAGAAISAGYFEVYYEALLENEYSVDALQRARPSLQAAAQKLLKAGSRPLAEKLQQAYSAALLNIAPQLADSLALKLDPDPLTPSNPGIVQKPPTVITSQTGNVTNMTIAGQLAAKHPVGCVPLSTLDNSRTPPDLYLGVSACILKDDYRAAAALFALAGVESHFDAERVADKSAGQAGQVLIMTTFDALPDDKRQEFQKTVTGLNADPKGMAPICRAIEKIGYPTYYPEYMVLHGIHAFTAKPGDATLVANFDAATTWNFLLTNYLSCHDVPPAPPAPTQSATVANHEPTNPKTMMPGLYQVRSNVASQAPDLRNEEALRLCFTPAMIAAANPVPQAGQCSQLNIVHKGNTTHTDFSCAKDGVAATGRSDETLEGNRRYSVIDLTTTDNTGTHPLHLITEMIFLGRDCNATYADPSSTTNSLSGVAPSPPVQATVATAITSDGWPIPPDKHLSFIKGIPSHHQIVLEVRFKNRTGVPNEIAVFDLTTGNESKWDVLSDAMRDIPATAFGSQAAWAQGSRKLLYATHKSVHLVSTDGSASELHLQMPGKASLLDGMSAYAISADGQQVAYTLNARDRSQLQTDGFGKLYTDLMIQKSEGSPPITVWNDRSAVLESAWRPDGAAIAHTDSDHNLVVSDLNGKTLWSFHPGPPIKNGSIADFIQEIRWDPSGKHLAFLMGFPIQKVYVVNADGSGTKEVQFHGFPDTDRDLSIAKFAWSPDGRKFAFRSQAGSTCNKSALGYKYETGNYPCIYSWNLMTADIDGSHVVKAIESPDYEFGELFWIQ